MLSRRALLNMLPGAVLTYGATACEVRAGSPVASDWAGERVRRISPKEQTELASALRQFFGQSQGDVVSSALVPGIDSMLLFNQFAAVDYGFIMDEYMLPSGRIIWDRSDGRSGVDAVVVPESASGTLTIAAAALLTHLCPRGGVDEVFTTQNGSTYKEHFRCQLDYSLTIFYAHGATTDPDLNADLTKWAQATISGNRYPFPVRLSRKLRLKRFVRVL